MATVRPYPVFADQRNAMLEPYVNQSDGSVGIIGKAIGALGLDIEGRRAATSWEDAWHNSIDADRSGRPASFLPITSDGGYGVPTFVTAADEGIEGVKAQAADTRTGGNVRPQDQDWEQAKAVAGGSLDAAGLAPMVGLGAGMVGAVPEGAIAANGIGRAVSHLPMDDASRLSRARDMGFDTDRTWYHGTNTNFQDVDPTKAGTRHAHASDTGFFLSEDPATASAYARGAGLRDDLKDHASQQSKRWFWQREPDWNGPTSGGSVIPAYVKNGKQGVVDVADMRANGRDYHDEIKALREQGFDSVLLKNNEDAIAGGTPDELVMLNPANVRSTFAAFDPAKSDSANLLYSNSPSSASVPLAVNGGSAPLAFNDYEETPHSGDDPVDDENQAVRGLAQLRGANSQLGMLYDQGKIDLATRLIGGGLNGVVRMPDGSMSTDIPYSRPSGPFQPGPTAMADVPENAMLRAAQTMRGTDDQLQMLYDQGLIGPMTRYFGGGMDGVVRLPDGSLSTDAPYQPRNAMFPY